MNDYVHCVSFESNYWLVRTMGGRYYKDFVDNGFIAIGHNEITLRKLQNLNIDEKLAFSELKNDIEEHYQATIKHPGHAASQLIRFVRNIGEGDIIVIPSRGNQVAICRVIGDVYEDINATDEHNGCPFFKRIPIQVKKLTYRSQMSAKAQLMFNSRHPISDINTYSSYIDNTVLDFYNKGEDTHLLLRINTNSDVTASTFYGIDELFKLAEGFCLKYGIDGKASDVTMKVQMESPGWLHFFSRNKRFLGVIGAFILLINGGGLRIDFDNLHIDLSTDGLIKNVNDYLDREQDREIRHSIKTKLDTLEIKTPDDYMKAVIELYRTQNETRNKY